MAKIGHIPMLTPEVGRIILESVGQGAVYELAAQRAGVSKRSIYNWLARGRKGGKANAIYVHFLHALEKAKGDRATLSLARIGKAGQGGAVIERTSTTRDGVTTVKEKIAQPQWTADAWLLERLHDEHYGLNKTELATMRREMMEMRKALTEAGLNFGSDHAKKKAS